MTDATARCTQFDPEPDSSHNLVVGRLPRAGKVLELGCATGYMEVLENIGTDHAIEASAPAHLLIDVARLDSSGGPVTN